MRKIFSILFLCCSLFLCDLMPGSLARCAELPAAVFLKARIKLKNGGVIKKQNYLFTKVNLKPSAGSLSSLAESKASLYAQRNFAKYLFGQINWEDKFTPTELHLIQALYGQVGSFSGVLRGLTLIQSFPQNGIHAYIYAVNVLNRKTRKIGQREAVTKIQTAVNSADVALDYLTYLEIALRKPEIFNPKIAVKRLGEIYGSNFIFFMLGMNLENPTSFATIPHRSKARLIGLNKTEIAILLNERPYNTVLAFVFANKLLETGDTELAKLVVKSGCRLEKSGVAHDQIILLATRLNVDPSGSYSQPISSNKFQQLILEAADAGVELNFLSEVILNSLGDVPLNPSTKQIFFPAYDYSKMTKDDFVIVFHELQEKQKTAANKDLFEATAELLNANGYPLMAYCFWHQALYMDSGNSSLRKKILEHASKIDFSKYSKLLSPET